MLSSFRVLDLTWVLGGPFAGQLLSQLGAEVIKVEPLEGDLSRQVSRHGSEFHGDSGFFLSVNRGKNSIALNLKTDKGKEILHDLVRKSDAIIYGFAPSVPKKLGLDEETLHKINPKIAIGQLIGLHDEPPYSEAPAFDLVIQALSGVMSITGEKNGAPVRVGYQIADLAGGLYLALACVGAMLKSLKTGVGETVQISLLDCQLALLTWQAQNFFVSGEVPFANGARHPVIAPSDIYPCLDGNFIAISPTGQDFWRMFCNAIDRSDLIDDERFKLPKSRVENVQALTEILSEKFSKQTSDFWEKSLFEQRIPSAKINNVGQALTQPLSKLRNMVEEVNHPTHADKINFLGNPFKYTKSKKLNYPPALGGETRNILCRVCGYSELKITELLENNIIYQGKYK
jgi:crotonobetainyl-CoA:carnitine CoA-transferase CaiB-like acyl-CoA transferase